MTDSFFYCDIDLSSGIENNFIEKLRKFSEASSKQIYVISKPLGEKNFDCSYKDGAIVLVPNYKIMVINFENDCEDFNDYYEDIIEHLGYASIKYDYKKILGRSRTWEKEFINKINISEIKELNIESLLEPIKLETKESQRNGEFLISLLTGSINDVKRVGGDFPETLLEKIKRKIILFDGDQTKFIYDEPHKKRITVQGLAGTGKTELLLHKLKDLYTKENDTKIVLTCHNKILAQNLRTRIPDFFDFMKVDEQIKWNERLWTMHGWGSQSDKNSGLYSYICGFYSLNFEAYSWNNSFEIVCERALEKLIKLENFEPCFDYVLIDESQDFPESFFLLCEKVSKYTVYIAGDIFQNIFEYDIVGKIKPDFLLNKCYRTDPRTLMFAHAVGMGLFETHKLRWLSDDEWKACGYEIKKINNIYNLSRKTLRRFEDLENEGTESIKLILSDEGNDFYVEKVISIIKDIRKANPTVEPDDIGIAFLEGIKENYNLTNLLQYYIEEKFGWNVNVGYESKTKKNGKLFISNKNNIKGLEFPFVICITRKQLSDNVQMRNSIYMMLTRSFITTYLIVPVANNELNDKFKDGIDNINKTGYLSVTVPSETEKENLTKILIDSQNANKSEQEMIEDKMNLYKITSNEKRQRLLDAIKATFKDDFDIEQVEDYIKLNMKFFS